MGEASKIGLVSVSEVEPSLFVFEAGVPEAGAAGGPTTVPEAFVAWLASRGGPVAVESVEASPERIAVKLRPAADPSASAEEPAIERPPAYPVSRTVFTYDADQKLVATRGYDGSGRVTTYTYYRDEPIAPAHAYVLALTTPGGARIERVLVPNWAEADPAGGDDPRRGEARELAALANALDMIPLLSGRWRLARARGGPWPDACYEGPDRDGRVIVTHPGGGEAEELAVPEGHRLVRVADPASGRVEHVAEPVGHEVAYEFDAAGALVRLHPPGRPRRVL
jgi:hypothetical protein